MRSDSLTHDKTMTDSIQRRIKRGAILIYGTLLLAMGQSILLHLGTTDYGHRIISTYFVIEILILGVTVIGGLKNKWTRVILIALTAFETILFFQDTPISPDEILMIMAWCIRVYVIAGLFTRTMNQYYKMDN
jgi:hypothetical protein